MQWIWCFVGIPLAGLLCFVYLISRGASQDAPRYVDQFAKGGLPNGWDGGFSLHGKRTIRWITARKFAALVESSQQVILIGLGSKSIGTLAEFKCSHALIIDCGEVLEVLRWSPPSSRIVIYGSRDECAATVSTVRKVPGAAPVYLLPDGSGSEPVNQG